MDDELSKLKQIKDLVFSFFCESSDFNGIALRNISESLGLDYEDSIDKVKQLVSEGDIAIQSSTNPHIIGFTHHPIKPQLDILEQAKGIEISKKTFGSIKVVTENTQYPICVYPSKEYLERNRDLSGFGYAKYSTTLALAEPQLSFRFFETDVLERYSGDPRFEFEFHDFSGSISSKYDEFGQSPIVS